MNFFSEHWDWYVAGPLIGSFVPLLLIIGNKSFGISSSFDYICSIIAYSGKRKSFSLLSAENAWKVYFVIGIIIGAFIAAFFLSDEAVQFLPQKYYTFKGFITLFIGGILVGFGTRYANGCTAGHSITGISLLNAGSIKSTISFFVGGLIYTFISGNFF
jgi:uncharacterized membrane protein YedE/YeeE